MKFDQAIKEGFANYVSEDEDQISIGRDVLESIRDLINDDDVVKIAVEKHRDNPNLFKAINKLIFKVDSLLAPKKEEFPEDEMTLGDPTRKNSSVSGVKNLGSSYNLDDHVEQAAAKANKLQKFGGSFGVGVGAYGAANAAVKRRDKVVGLAAKKYDEVTKNIENVLKRQKP